MIEAKLRRKLGQFQLNAELRSEGVICVVGNNGSGKTCLLRAIAGFLPIDDGFVKVGGEEITNRPVESRGVVLVTPFSGFLHLDVDSHIKLGARLNRRHSSNDDKVSRIKADLGIDFKGPVRKLSMGMRQRVSLATALLASPRAILVDEAFSNLHDRAEFIATYGKLVSGAGLDLVFTSQDFADSRLAHDSYAISNGVTSQILPNAI